MRVSKIDKKRIILTIVQNLHRSGRYDIKTIHSRDFTNPDKIMWKGKSEGFVPDLTARRDNLLNIYDIQLTDNYELTKWKLFSLYANIRKANFYIVTPRWMVNSVKDTLVENVISARIIDVSEA
ncbi:MAG: hypothetical protein ACOCXW_00120 [Bacteroidota bacterium]